MRVVGLAMLAEKDAQCESCKLGFIWGQNDVCSLGDSNLDSSVKLFQKGSGGRSIYVILVKGKFMQSSAYFTKVFLLVKRPDVIMKGLSAFLDMRKCKDWDHEISS